MKKTRAYYPRQECHTSIQPRSMRISLPAPTFPLDITHDRSETAPPNRIIRTEAPTSIKGPTPYHTIQKANAPDVAYTRETIAWVVR